MRNRRHKHFVDLAVQGALARRITLHWLIFLAMACLALPLWQLRSHGVFSSSFSQMMTEGWVAMAPVFIILIAMLPIFVWDTVKFSHRFTGPMCRFQKAIRSLAAGEETRSIRLRKGDFWTEFADDFNQMLERVESDRENASPADNADAVACGTSAGDADRAGEFGVV